MVVRSEPCPWATPSGTGRERRPETSNRQQPTTPAPTLRHRAPIYSAEVTFNASFGGTTTPPR